MPRARCDFWRLCVAISERLLMPGQEGSEQALQILQLLHQTTPAGGVSITDVCALLQLSLIHI